MKKLLCLVLVSILALSLVSVASAELLGMASVTGIQGADAGEKDGNNQVNTTYCTVLLDDKGVIVKVQFDVVQTKVSFSKEGKLITDPATFSVKTKIEKGAEYGMIKASGIQKEWFEQAAAFEAYCIGKTVEEVLATPTYKKDDNHLSVPDVADLKTLVTMDIGEFLEVLEKAVANAR
ncbi:MAG: hypothetical protein AB9880_04260 [Christensenellales bacterium]